ncbi:MAG: prepilin-type N-terminal cleavage/methylation domain-containing protein [Candidatus Omnitrophota bacterium]|jgi:prepilin-type N-terminal cleavage/methylation domain-containing protein
MRSFTLVELVVVVLIVGILVAFALPAYRVTQERVLEGEAKANLMLIQSAQRIYRMEYGAFINCPSRVDLNTNLKLTIPTDTVWSYSSEATGCGQATRGVIQWRLRQAEDTPVSSVCP